MFHLPVFKDYKCKSPIQHPKYPLIEGVCKQPVIPSVVGYYSVMDKNKISSQRKNAESWKNIDKSEKLVSKWLSLYKSDRAEFWESQNYTDSKMVNGCTESRKKKLGYVELKKHKFQDVIICNTGTVEQSYWHSWSMEYTM